MTPAGGAMAGLAVTVVLGWLWISDSSRFHGATRIGFSYGVGLVWMTTAMGMMAVLGVPLTRWVAGSVIVSFPVGWSLWRRQLRSRWPAESQSMVLRLPQSHALRDPWWWGAGSLVGVLVGIVVARAVVKPVQAWDAWSTYATKAKMIYLDMAISRSIVETGVAPNYPLGVPLQEVWMAWFTGTWDDVAIKLLFPGYLVALLCLAYGELRERWSARAAMGGTLFIASLPLLLQHGQVGYADLPLAYFVLGGAVALTRFFRTNHRDALALGAVLAVGMVWCRADGVVLVVINAALLLYDGVWTSGVRSRRGWSPCLLYAAPPAAVWGGWALVKLVWSIPENLPLSVGGAAGLDRLGGASDGWLTALFLEGNWLVLWTLVFLALAYGERELRRKESAFLIWPVLGYLGVIALLSTVTDLYDFLEIGTVLNRLILHVAPLAALWVVITYGRWWGLETPGAER